MGSAPVLWLVILCIASGLLVAAPKLPTPISLLAQDWIIWPGLPTQPSSFPDGAPGWFFVFPDQASGTVGYVYTPFTASLSTASALTMTVQTQALSGTPIYRYDTEPGNTCVFPAHTRLLLQRQGDAGQFGRWWSNPIAYDLNDQAVQTLTTPLTPDQWSDVFGQFGTANPQKFARILRNHDYIGLTFGGGCFFAHGVFVSDGSARFLLLNLQVL